MLKMQSMKEGLPVTAFSAPLFGVPTGIKYHICMPAELVVSDNFFSLYREIVHQVLHILVLYTMHRFGDWKMETVALLLLNVTDW